MAFSTSINTSLLSSWLVKKFIPTLEAELQISKFATKAIIPPGEGVTGRFNVFSNPPGTTTALTEGATLHDFPTTLNQITTLTTTGTTCTISEYGEWIKVNNIQAHAAMKGWREELVKRMAYGGALCIDTLVMNLVGTTGFSGQSKSAAAASPWTAASTVKPTANSLATLMSCIDNNICNISSTKGIPFSGVSGHRDGTYAALFSPRAMNDMVTEGTTGKITWQNAVVNVAGPNAQGSWVSGYLGECYGTSVYRCQTIQTATVTSLCDLNVILSEGGLGAVAFEDMEAKIVINDVNSPYKNADSIAWYAKFGCNVIDGNRIVKLYTLAA